MSPKQIITQQYRARRLLEAGRHLSTTRHQWAEWRQVEPGHQQIHTPAGSAAVYRLGRSWAWVTISRGGALHRGEAAAAELARRAALTTAIEAGGWA